MRVGCKRSGPEMADCSSLLNSIDGNQISNNKQELIRKFVEYLQSDQHMNHKHKMHGSGHGCHGKFGRGFGKHGHGKHHGRHGHHGPHGHRGPHAVGWPHIYGPHSHRGPHGHGGPHGHHGPRGHGGPHGHHGPRGHGEPHGHHGRHGLHSHHKGKFWAQWTIDLTHDESGDNTDRALENGRNPSPPPQGSNEAPNGQAQEAEVNKQCNCKCSRFDHHPRGRPGRWRLCPYKRNKVSTTENACQTEENVEETPDNLTLMVENINIENAE